MQQVDKQGPKDRAGLSIGRAKGHNRKNNSGRGRGGAGKSRGRGSGQDSSSGKARAGTSQSNGKRGGKRVEGGGGARDDEGRSGREKKTRRPRNAEDGPREAAMREEIGIASEIQSTKAQKAKSTPSKAAETTAGIQVTPSRKATTKALQDEGHGKKTRSPGIAEDSVSEAAARKEIGITSKIQNTEAQKATSVARGASKAAARGVEPAEEIRTTPGIQITPSRKATTKAAPAEPASSAVKRKRLPQGLSWPTEPAHRQKLCQLAASDLSPPATAAADATSLPQLLSVIASKCDLCHAFLITSDEKR